jgi:putative peptidoglycan lipid II flippase
MQFLFTFFSSFRFFVKRLGVKEFFKPKIFSLDVKKIIRPIFLGILGIGAVQINTALDAFFAKAASSSGPAYLWYAARLSQLPLALFGIAISGAILPPLSRAVREGDFKRCENFLKLAVKKTIFFIVTASFGILVLGGSSINLLFGRGAFLEISVVKTLFCLWGYSFGLLFSCFVLILSAAFYAGKNYSIPMKGAVYSVILNIFLNGFFIFFLKLGAFSVAISTSFAAIFNFFYLYKFLKRDFRIFDEKILKVFTKVFVCNLVAFILVGLFGYFSFKDPSIFLLVGKKIENFFPRNFLSQLRNFTVMAFFYFSIVFSLAYVLKVEEVLEFFSRYVLRIRKQEER